MKKESYKISEESFNESVQRFGRDATLNLLYDIISPKTSSLIEENEFELSDAKMDKIEEMEDYISHLLSKPIFVRGYYWGIDKNSIDEMRIRISLANEHTDVYHVDIFDYYGTRVNQPQVVRMKNILGRMNLAHETITTYHDRLISAVKNVNSIRALNDIKFEDVIAHIRNSDSVAVFVDKEEIRQKELTHKGIRDMILDSLNDLF